MGENTTIEWATHSWSPWRGCTKVSPGCAHCYAEALSKRNPAVLGQWGKGRPRVLAKNWKEPVRWDARAAWLRQCPQGHRFQSNPVLDDGGFCPICDEPEANFAVTTVFPSLCDWLDEEVPIEWLVRFLTLIHDTPNLTWLLLTKRPENFRDRLKDVREWACVESDFDLHGFVHKWLDRADLPPPANVWVGTSVEDQIRADERIPKLLEIPAAGRFLSVEPLLGPVNLGYRGAGGLLVDGVGSKIAPQPMAPTQLDWVIVGGESGSGARPCNVKWIRSLVGQCKAADVPVFVKQVGAEPVFNAPRRVDDWGQEHISEGAWISAMTHPKGGDPAEWYYDLRVREFPVALGGAR